MIIKKCETRGIKYKHCECCLEYANVKDDLIEYKRFFCDKNYQNIYKFILLLQKGVCPYEYMENWEKFNEIYSMGHSY